MSEALSGSVSAIICTQHGGELRLTRTALLASHFAAKQEVGQADKAIVWVIQDGQIGTVHSWNCPTVDCGRKHPARPLSAILMGRNGIPVLDGGFKSVGQLVRSLKQLLRNAADAKERGPYIIGVKDPLFDKLWARAQPDGLRNNQAEDDESDQSLTLQSLLDIMPWRKVPPELEQFLIGVSPQIQFTRQLILQAAQHDGPVLILGDTGTGKERVAWAIHNNSNVKVMNFFAVNCGAISRDLIESELFGHKKGAFTGANEDKVGLWKAADNGTLFLDEVGDLPLEHQVKVLRALDTHFIRPVGETREIPVNARVIAATNRDLMGMMDAGQFRPDLYYRLRSFLIHTDPLAKHPEDIPLLARHFWRDIAKVPGASLSDEFIKALQSIPWVGNVRDLKWTLVSLYRYTGMGNPTPKHLRTVVWYENQRNLPRLPSGDKLSIDAHRVECLMHLRRADDILRACAVAMQPVLTGKRTNRKALSRAEEALRRHAGELEILCLHPLLFTDNGAFKAVEQFKCGVADLLRVLRTHPAKAKEFWEKQLSSQLREASQAVFQQVDRLVKRK